MGSRAGERQGRKVGDELQLRVEYGPPQKDMDSRSKQQALGDVTRPRSTARSIRAASQIRNGVSRISPPGANQAESGPEDPDAICESSGTNWTPSPSLQWGPESSCREWPGGSLPICRSLNAERSCKDAKWDLPGVGSQMSHKCQKRM